MSRLRGTLILVALVAFGGFVGLWIRRQAPAPGLQPHATPRTPEASQDHGHAETAPPRPAPPRQLNPKASLVVRLRCSGKPVAGVPFTLIEEATHQNATYTTGPDGAHAILLLPAGEYHVVVNHSDYVQAAAHRMVEADKPHEVVVELDRGGMVAGKVTDASGRPLEGTHVLLMNSEGSMAGRSLEAKSDATGQYRIVGIPPGMFDLRFHSVGYRAGVRQGVAIAGTGQEFRVDMVLMEGKTITGKVVTVDGMPISGATVIGSNEEVSTCRTDEQGAYSLQGLGDGTVSAFASAVGYGPVYLRNLAPGSSGVDFRLSKAAEIVGKISCRPLPGKFTVKIYRLEEDLGKFIPLYTRPYDGSLGDDFRVGELPAGRYRLEVEAAGFETQDIPEMDVVAGQILTGVQIRLRKSS